MLSCYELAAWRPHAKENIYIPVNGDIISGFVGNFDDQSVAIVHFQGWSRVHSVDSDCVVSFAQPLHWGCLNLFR